MNKTNVKRGFTLGELLVGIGIIAILIGILLPALSKARQQSQTVACLSNLAQIAKACYNYSIDNKGFVVPGQYTQSTINTTLEQYSWDADETWCNILVNTSYVTAPDAAPGGNYLKLGPQVSRNIFYCPAGNADFPSPDFANSATPPTSRDDMFGAQGMRYFSFSGNNAVDCWYSMNMVSGGDARTDGGFPCRRIDARPTVAPGSQTAYNLIQLSSLRRSAETVYLFDGLFGNLPNNPNRINARHNQRTVVNLGFFDGHAASVRAADLPGGMTVAQANYGTCFALSNLQANYSSPQPLWLLGQQNN